MSVEDTSKRQPIEHLVGLMAGSSAYITGMEADGQRQLVSSSLMPVDAPWSELEALGFVKGEPVAGDALFVHCTLPQGWSKVGTGHAMHSSVVDERGVERVGIFYKAAFYDRSASAHVKNVGRDVATEVQYGDGKVVVQHLEVLTEQEKAAAVEELRYVLGRCEQSPNIHGKYEYRIREGLRILGAPDATPLVHEGF